MIYLNPTKQIGATMRLAIGTFLGQKNTIDGMKNRYKLVILENTFDVSTEDIYRRLRDEYGKTEIAETLLDRGTIIGLGKDADVTLYEDDAEIFDLIGDDKLKEIIERKTIHAGFINKNNSWNIHDGDVMLPGDVYFL